MEQNKQLDNHVVKPQLVIFTKDSDVEYRLVSQNDEKSLDSTIEEIQTLMREKNGKGKSEKEKDDLYGEGKELWEKYANLLRNTKYTFYLNRKQYQFLTNLLTSELEYDVNTLFLAIELTNMLGTWKNTSSHSNDNELKGYTADATEVTYIYHLISKYKIKGLTNASYRFAEVLRKIGDISKIIAYYDTHAKSFSKEIQDWVASFEDGVEIEKLQVENTSTDTESTTKSKKSSKKELDKTN